MNIQISNSINQIRIVTIFLLSIVIFSKSFSQNKISGTVFTEENKPLGFAIIGLKRDSTLIKSTVTDSLGNYSIQNISTNKYTLSFYFLGYKTKQLAIHVIRDTIINILLDDKAQELNEVVIQGNTGTLERKADRFVFSVANSEVTKGSTIYEVLKQAPLIMVNEGTNSISLINKPQTVIYINGKKSYLSQEALVNLLKNNSAENLSRVEIITVPGSSYDVKGDAGIINIIMKKNSIDNFNGNFRLSDRQAFFNTQSISTNLNYRKKKLGVDVNIYANNLNQMNEFEISYLFKQDNLLQTTITKGERPQFLYGGSLGIDYDINSKHTFGFKIDGMQSSQKQANSTNTSTFQINGSNIYDSLQQTINVSDIDVSDISLNGNYHYTIDSTGKFFNMDVDYIAYSNTQLNFNTTNLINENYTILQQRQKFKQNVPQFIKSLSSKIEYQHVFNLKNSLLLGVNASNANTDNDTYLKNFINGEYLQDSLQSFYYKYHETIAVFFTTYNRTWSKKWETSLGLRIENAQNNGGVETSKQYFKNNYYTLLPYIAASYTASEKNQFSYTFSNRISRPAFWELNPFRYYMSPNVYIENNPFLQPQRLFINELSYTLNQKFTFLIDYTYTDKKYEQFQLADNNNYVKWIRINYGTTQDASASMSFQQIFLKELIHANFSLNGGMIKYKGQAEYLKIDNTSYYFAITSNFTINISKSKKWFGMLYTSYNSPGKTSYGYVQSTNTISIGIKKRINQWSFYLFAGDVLKGTQLRYRLEDNKIFTNGTTYYDTRGISLSLTYSFGNNKLKTNRERETSNSDVKNRIQK